MLLGSHVSFKSDQLLGSVREAISYNANTFMFYTGAPNNTRRSEIKEKENTEARKLMEENNIDINKVICHAPYIVNLANKLKLDSFNFSISFLKSEIRRCVALGIKYIVLHPGNHMTLGVEIGLNNIIEGLNKILESDMNIVILIETMAGKGTECGSKIEEIKTILDGVILKDKIGVCIDTCHISDAGYNIEDYLNKFESLIGLDKLGCIHINDSKNPVGSHKDRHENIGFGYVGFSNILNIIYNDKLKDVPKILETPYIEGYPPYKFEIEELLNKEFDINLKNKVLEYYK
jgi:deoxyribonuclease IV